MTVRRRSAPRSLAALVVVVPAAAAMASAAGAGEDGAGSVTAPLVLRGGVGPDRLLIEDLGADAAGAAVFGGAGDDFVSAFPRSFRAAAPTPVALLSGGGGNDSITGYARAVDGGGGDDRIRTFELEQPIVTTVRCGGGVDTLRMDRQRAGPLDLFGSDCERIEVWIWSTVSREQVLGGTPYADFVRTLSDAIGGGDDTIRTFAGDDRVQGDWGSDTAYLGAGDDVYSDVSTHGRDDVDRITCGPGRDVVRAFRRDMVAADCEVVRYWG